MSTLPLLRTLALALAAAPFASAQQPPSCGMVVPAAPVTATGEVSSRAVVSEPTTASAADDPANLLTLVGQMDLTQLGAIKASDCWGYTSGSGRQYAIVCLWDSTAFVEITTPTSLVLVAQFPGAAGTWRDAKVYQDHAYVVSDTGGGLEIFDMSAIDSGVVAQLPSILTPGNLNTHNVAIDEDSGFLYRLGGTGEGLRIYDLNQSLDAPPLVASWNASYVHDAEIVTYTSGPAAGKQIAYCCTGTDLKVLNVTEKGNIGVLDTFTYSGLQYCHQAWLDDARQYLYINDEQDELNLGVPTTTIVADVSNPANVTYVTRFDNGQAATGHNCYIDGDLLYESNNASGLRVFDLGVDPLDPPEIGFYDTNASSAAGFVGLWSVFPYFDNGLVIGSDRELGLLVWYSGTPLDVSLASSPPALLQPAGQVLPVTILEGTPGNLLPGTETLHYDDGGGWQTVPLAALGGGSYEAAFGGLGCGTLVDYYFSAQSSNGFLWTDPFLGQAAPYSGLVGTSIAVTFADDFETDKGWVPENVGATAGFFERGVPVGDPLWPAAPAADADGSGQCWLTGNQAGNSDVDNGAVRLVSPVLDLSVPNPVVQYDYWAYLSDGSGLDFFRVRADDGLGGGFQTVAESIEAGVAEWRRRYLTADDFAAAGVSLTANVTLRFIAKDADPQTTVEAALDGFQVFSLACSTATSYCTAGTTASGCTATLAAAGVPSLSQASGFTVTASNGEGSKDGLFFFSQNGQQANPWGNGTSFQCVAPPVQRTPVIAGVGTGGACDGVWALDFNAWMAAHPGKAPAAGPGTQMQLWFRDPQNTSNQTTSLSDGIEFSVAP